MGLLTHGLAAACGYLVGRADGRTRLARVGRRATDLVRRRGKDPVDGHAQPAEQDGAVRSDDAVQDPGSGDARSGGRPAGHGPRARTWRSRFSRSKTVHFPSSAEARAARPGTTAVEDPEAPLPGAGTTH